MSELRVPRLAIAAAAAVLLPAGALRADETRRGGGLKTYPTRYYLIHTDLDRDGVREAAVRMTAMAEEYHRRTRGFSGTVRQRLPFYLFRNREDYHAAGGLPGSSGVFKGRSLMAVAGDRPSDRTWHVVQHEGFHQFARAVIRGDIPVWVNEGLAEYFGHAIFTGDGFVVGLVPPQRLRRLQGEIRGGALKRLRLMMDLTYQEWTHQINAGNYDQAWSMIHFLVHGEDGRYVKGLSGFMNDTGRGTRYERAWVRNFGRDVDGFEKRWRKHWLAQPANPTEDLYAEAVVATLTSFFARASSQGQAFETGEAFLAAAEAGTLKAHSQDWLPPSLLAKNLPQARRLGRWAVETPERMAPRLTCTVGEDKTFVGLFWLKGTRVDKVRVELAGEPPESQEAPSTRPAEGEPATAPATAPAEPQTRPGEPTDPVARAIGLARAYRAMGQAAKARRLLEAALKEAPRSPRAAEARGLLAELK